MWQDVLSVRYLVAPPARDVRTWLKFGALCRKSGRGALAHKILVDVLGTDPALVPPHELPAMQPAVCFAFVKQLWERGGEARCEALERLRGFVLEPLAVQDHHLAAKAWLKLGRWQREMIDAHWLEARAAAPILQSLQRATELKPASYKAWHWLAMINFEAAAPCPHSLCPPCSLRLLCSLCSLRLLSLLCLPWLYLPWLYLP